MTSITRVGKSSPSSTKCRSAPRRETCPYAGSLESCHNLGADVPVAVVHNRAAMSASGEKLSVIIPVLSDAVGLLATLDEVLALRAELDEHGIDAMEILVIDTAGRAA